MKKKDEVIKQDNKEEVKNKILKNEEKKDFEDEETLPYGIDWGKYNK